MWLCSERVSPGRQREFMKTTMRIPPTGCLGRRRGLSIFRMYVFHSSSFFFVFALSQAAVTWILTSAHVEYIFFLSARARQTHLSIGIPGAYLNNFSYLITWINNATICGHENAWRWEIFFYFRSKMVIYFCSIICWFQALWRND